MKRADILTVRQQIKSLFKERAAIQHRRFGAPNAPFDREDAVIVWSIDEEIARLRDNLDGSEQA